ncbi:hypothetical protein KJZ61_03020 [Candidatus Dependentiae bacterium]|nr:hypothetical protein [Candidatus Dependentiae bacterium]
MRKWSILFVYVALCGVSGQIFPTEYVYPVAMHQQPDVLKLYLIYQRTPEYLELWLWDPVTTKGTRLLLSTYVPAGLRILPGGSGLSFIDNGRIRVKRFAQQALQTIALDEPIYNLSLINWIDDRSFYCSAQRAERFALFYCDTDGHVSPLCMHADADYLYPQKIQRMLYAIRRTINKDGIPHYSVVKVGYDLSASNAYPTVLYEHGNNPIVFLDMISEHEGFFVEHPALIYEHHSLLPCSYYHFWYHRGVWEVEKLFDFTLPTTLLFPHHQDTVLHETLLRLVPMYHDGLVFFCDISDVSMVRRRAANLDIYVYDMELGTKNKLSHAHHGQFFFSPLLVQNTLYFGGQISDRDDRLPMMWLDEQGDICFKLPSASITH